jgi:hypothetical protein
VKIAARYRLLIAGIALTTNSTGFAANTAFSEKKAPEDLKKVAPEKESKMEVAAVGSQEVNTTETKPPMVTTIDDIPAWCAYLVIQLSKQPIAKITGFSPLRTNRGKFLCLETVDDASLCFTLNAFTSHFVTGNYWPIYFFWGALSTSNQDFGICMDEADQNRISHPPETATLCKAYQTALTALMGNWHLSTLKENPDIGEAKDEKHWVLMLEDKERYPESDPFIQDVINKLRLDKKIKSYYTRKQNMTAPLDEEDPTSEYLAEHTIIDTTAYFWIERRYLEEVNQKLQLKLKLS